MLLLVLLFIMLALTTLIAPQQVADEYQSHQNRTHQQSYLPVGLYCNEHGRDNNQDLYCKITKKEPNGLLDSYA